MLRARFPAGTVSGAPKVRAMEIINELEPNKRGPYAGAVGYLGFSGDMDMAIAIRTAVIKDGTVTCRRAPGIVADSVPERNRRDADEARAVIRAAGWPKSSAFQLGAGKPRRHPVSFPYQLRP